MEGMSYVFLFTLFSLSLFSPWWPLASRRYKISYCSSNRKCLLLFFSLSLWLLFSLSSFSLFLCLSLSLYSKFEDMTVNLSLKEQYPVTTRPLNFDFWTGCREIKRCEESKKTLKNPFVSRLAEFCITLKLLRITDQWYIVPAESFDLGEIGIFWRHFYCRWPEDQKMGITLMPIEGLFLLPASIQARLIMWKAYVEMKQQQ